MSKRLQVLFEEREYRRIERAARVRSMTVSEWVRQAVREAALREPVADRGAKLAAVRVAASHAFPTGDIEQMLAEIGGGRAELPE